MSTHPPPPSYITASNGKRAPNDNSKQSVQNSRRPERNQARRSHLIRQLGRIHLRIWMRFPMQAIPARIISAVRDLHRNNQLGQTSCLRNTLVIESSSVPRGQWLALPRGTPAHRRLKGGDISGYITRLGGAPVRTCESFSVHPKILIRYLMERTE